MPNIETATNAKRAVERGAMTLCPKGEGYVKHLDDDELSELYQDSRMLERAAGEEQRKREEERRD